MRNKRLIFIFTLVGLLLLLGFYFITKKERAKKYNWTENYKEKSKEPYGTHIIYEIMQNYAADKDFHHLEDKIEEALLFDSTTQNANFVFIGEGILLDSLDIVKIVTFIEQGNNAFFSTKTIPDELMKHFYNNRCYSYDYDNVEWEDYHFMYDSLTEINLINPTLKVDSNFVYSPLYKDDESKKYYWHYIYEDMFCYEGLATEYSIEPLGELDGQHINFARIPKGEGYLLLHTTPIAFTNVQLIREAGFDYVSKVFSYLNEGDIYWCEARRMNEEYCRKVNNSTGRPGEFDRGGKAESPLKYILAQPSLAWAWYVSLALGLIFIGFKAKREQRMIPVLAENKNTSLEFVSTVGKLYFMQNDHRNLCQEKMRLFLADIRDKYSIPTKELNEKFEQKLTIKSEVAPSIISKILTYHKNIESSETVTEKTMVEFHQLIELFYTKSNVRM